MAEIRLGIYSGIYRRHGNTARYLAIGYLLATVLAIQLDSVAKAASGTTSAATNRGGGHSLWRTSGGDGIHCLYILLGLSGQRVDYVGLLEAAAAHRGRTLADLCKLASRFGVHLVARRRTPAMLTRDRLPAIVHLDDPAAGPGRFALLLRCDAATCLVVSGDRVTIEQMSMDEFRRAWSGVVLERETGSVLRVASLSIGLGLCAVGLYAARLFERAHRGA